MKWIQVRVVKHFNRLQFSIDPRDDPFLSHKLSTATILLSVALKAGRSFASDPLAESESLRLRDYKMDRLNFQNFASHSFRRPLVHPECIDDRRNTKAHRGGQSHGQAIEERKGMYELQASVNCSLLPESI